jgi:hypothetical protein
MRKHPAKLPATMANVIVLDESDSDDIRVPRGMSKKAAGKLPAVALSSLLEDTDADDNDEEEIASHNDDDNNDDDEDDND